MATPSPYEQYRLTQVQTSTPEGLVLLAFDGLVTRLSMALAALEEARHDRASAAIVRAQGIIQELQGALNADAGAVAGNLDALYAYMQRRLVEANLRKDPEPVAEVLGYTRELRATWTELVARLRASHRAAHQEERSSGVMVTVAPGASGEVQP